MTGYFVLTVYDEHGQGWDTRPIELVRYDDVTTIEIQLAHEEYVENTLMSLPNQILTDVNVLLSTANNGITYTIEFKSVGGTLTLMSCNYVYCDWPGCAPRYSGLYSYGTVACTVAEGATSDKSLEECAGNGNCDRVTGICGCYGGATGAACELQDELL